MSIRYSQLLCIGLSILILGITTLVPAPVRAGTVQIEAGKMTLYHKKNQVVFLNQVHLTRQDFELYCDRLVAYYNEHNLDHADAFGHIKLNHGKATGSADKAVLNQAKGIITLSGNAVMEQDGNHVEGAQIIHNMHSDQTTVLPKQGGRTHMTIQSNDNGSAVLPATGK